MITFSEKMWSDGPFANIKVDGEIKATLGKADGHTGKEVWLVKSSISPSSKVTIEFIDGVILKDSKGNILTWNIIELEEKY